MKIGSATWTAAMVGFALSAGAAYGSQTPQNGGASPSAAARESMVEIARVALHLPPPTPDLRPSDLTDLVDTYCAGCHSDRTKRGNLSLEQFDVTNPATNLAVTEKVIRKLRLEMMPPPGARRPTGDSLRRLAETLERTVDRGARPNPGARTFQRLNRPEYERAVRDLLGIQVTAGDYLPLDTKSANFDNIADVQLLSPTLLEAYLTAAAAVSRMAVGDRNAPATQTVYRSSPFASQHAWDRLEGAPYGTRGGIVTMHTFPADGLYEFRVLVSGGVGTRLEDLDISLDGERIALLHYERGISRAVSSADAPQGADYVRSEPIALKAGQYRLSVAFVRRTEGPYEDLIKPHEWSRASNGTGSAGTTEPPHVMDVAINGPTNITGVSETPSRRIIFSCHPDAAAEQRACADQILTRLATRAYRRPVNEHDRTALLAFYDRGAAAGGFEEGVRVALQAMLASPHFVFRIEEPPAGARPGDDFRLSDSDLASRLSFFLWGSIPDDELLALAKDRRLSDRRTLERQVRRMLADPRAEALSTRFAAQWLRLQDLDQVHPDAFLFPDFSQQIANLMRRETELFFGDIVQRDRSILELFTADYTFVNEQLARHYGIRGVAGTAFQRVNYPDETRRGLLGHGSILVQTSLGNRTSPVLRGKWVMEVLLGMPPPPPPPNVPDLEQTREASNGRPLTTRERMEIHRENPTCNTCHQYIDPIGLALDNFDVTGRWRYRENGAPLDTRGQMYDGTPVTAPAELTRALLKRPTPLVRAFTENLMAYALGRRVEDYDQPAIREIERAAESNGYRVSSFIMAVVNSHAFQHKRADVVTEPAPAGQR
jgi:hypothetical protein